MVVALIRTYLSINLYGITPNQPTIIQFHLPLAYSRSVHFFRKLRWRKFTDGVAMPEILQILHQPPPSQIQLHSRVQGGVVNVESELNCSFESDFGSRGGFDDTENFECCEFVGSCFTEFSNSSVDELSKVTAFIQQNQSFRKRKHESVDCDSGLVGSPKAKKNTRNEDSKPMVNPKPDYVHVRARHGQATDRHSLAERARREKIKKKMQYLQDLVPGCNKLTNKAAILDEIITYVQCLQRHVEFLTMKLAASTTTVDFNTDISLPEEEIELSRQQ